MASPVNDDALVQAIAAGHVESTASPDERLTKVYAVHQQIDYLFDCVRLPAGMADIGRLSRGVPERLGRYRIDRLLGSSNNEVYLAYDEQLKRNVAIKVAQSPDAGLLEDARKAAQLRHDGIVAIYGVEREADGAVLVVMEYLEGGSLADRLAGGGRFSPKEAAQLVAAVADAVQHAHENGLVHRDVKPQNILFDKHGRPHVVDFGLAVHESEQPALAGQVCGTLAYMSPEHVRGEVQRMDGRADIWSLGVVLYLLLTGRKPFDCQRRDELFDAIQNTPPRPPRQRNAAIPRQLERICLRCLEKDATARYATAADLARELRRFCRPSHFRRTLLLAIAAVALAATVAVCARWNPASPQLPPQAINGSLDIMVWRQDPGDNAQGDSIDRGGLLPLRPGDAVRIMAELNRPAYMYLVWIDGDGKATPLYPWKEGDWEKLPQTETAADSLSLPAEAWQSPQTVPGWPITAGSGGKETLLVCVRETPLDRTVDVKSLFDGLPPQPKSTGKLFVLFENGVPRLQRGLDAKKTVPVPDPCLALLSLLQSRVEEHVAYTMAVSFAVQEK